MSVVSSQSANPHLFYIPTNRDSTIAVRSYFEEVQFLRGLSDAPVYFALIESKDDQAARTNAEEVSRLNIEVSARGHATEAGVIHFTVDRQHTFLENVIQRAGFIQDEAERLLALLLPEGIAYGAGPNKAALMAAALGVDVLHRRDSDTAPDMWQGKALFPSEIEYALIGRTLSDVADRIDEFGHFDPSSTIYFVASDYQGDLPVDRLELAELSEDLLIDHERLEHPAWTLAQLRESAKSYYLERNSIPYSHDSISIDTTGQTELGVSCVFRLFRDLPEMPLQDTLGCDYMQKNLLYRVDWPIVYHNRRVTHRYSAERNTRQSADEFVRYNLMDARYKILWRIWSKHNRNLEAHASKLLEAPAGSVINAHYYADSFEQACEALPESELHGIVLDLAEIYKRAAHLATDGQREKYHHLALTLTDNAADLVLQVRQGIDDFCFLIQRWGQLITSANAEGWPRGD